MLLSNKTRRPSKEHPSAPLLPSLRPPSDAPQSKSAYENVLDLPDDMLRGISLSTLLAGGARLFARHGAAVREDPQGTYALSEQCVSLDYFCSHSWTTSRWQKYLALLVHFNMGRALIATVIMCYACLFIQLWCPDATPSWMWMKYPIQPDNAMGTGPMMAEFLLLPTFIFVLCTAHLVGKSRSLFLDIACIRQDSDAAKANGIATLGAVLDRSERMLVMCDAHYFTRLWCVFEVAAYTKRAGAARIDLLPLHEPLRILGMMADVAFYMTFSSIIFCVLNTVAPELLDYLMGGNFAIMGPVMWLVLGTPAQIFVLVAQMEAYRGRRAVSELVRFTLADAQCHSDSDRAELQQLIAKWFTESHEGGEDARRLGFHRFEQFVRHTLAPSVVGSQSFYAKVVICIATLALAPVFDTFCSDAITGNHLLGMVAFMMVAIFLVTPFKLLVFHWSAGCVLALRERCGCPAVPAYVIGVLLNNLSAIGFALTTLSAPNAITDPDYKLPDDGLDPTARKMFATQVATIIAGVTLLAILSNFKI